MRKRLFIHVGPHKTGTTSLQNFLFRYRKKLLTGGILFPDDEIAPWFTQHRLAFALRGIKDTRRHDQPDAEAELAWITKQIDRSKATTAVLSAESFFSMKPAAIKRLREAFAPYDCRIVFYARPQDETFVSTYAQKIKSPRTYFAEPIGPLLAAPQNLSPDLDLYGHATNWADEFGADNIDLRLYTATPDVRLDLLSLIGGDAFAHLVPDAPSGTANISPTIEALEHIRLFKQTKPDRDTRMRAQVVLTRHFAETGRRPFRLLSTDDRRYIRECFRPGNEKLFATFLGSENVFAPELVPETDARPESISVDAGEAVALTLRLIEREAARSRSHGGHLQLISNAFNGYKTLLRKFGRG